MRDKDLILRAKTTDLTTTEAVSWTEVYGLPTDGIDLYIKFPTAFTGTGTLDITVDDATGAVGSESAVDTIHTFKQITEATVAPMVLHARLSGYRRHVGITFTVVETSTPNFGKVEAWLAAGPFKIAGE